MNVCPKCQNANLQDASAELDVVSEDRDETEWWKCFRCGWRGRLIVGRRTETEADLDEGEDAGETTATIQAPGKRHCHAPGRKRQFCSQPPMKGKDFCKKHLDYRPVLTAAAPTTVVVHRGPVVRDDVMPTTDLDAAITQLRDDLAVLERARDIMQRSA